MGTALTCYSVGVWAEFFSGRLKPWHAIMFWLGFVSDTAGTELMRQFAGGFHWSFHTFIGAAALLLMLGHAIWATVVLRRQAESLLRSFHRISVVVWAIWLIPFVTGLVLGRRHGH
jgi:uncharacterized repeat protein (TIGR03987 family)